ncbi:hypothetical protein J7443_07425 [Tropicibacter sp. R15_0]|uniref:DUF6525 family protein n=1 Tax=Tropicibacter sp. R15_0 TaxID=2821101 RepID=UPI001ADC6304|nr:DUF6525 family protein [Tropicibacter sp. R15_0]MBO9465054.1 hypothetical protein [Tropicibacter sp. R15_0]
MQSGNLGATHLRRSKRNIDPMAAYDALPKELRHWMAGAKLPWSAHSCLKIWRRAKSASEAVERLARAEAKALEKEQTKFAKLRNS